MSYIKLLNCSLHQKSFLSFIRPTLSRIYSSLPAGTIRDIDDEPPADELPITSIDDENLSAEREARIEQLRNKSRLLPQHRNMLHNRRPYDESQSWIHETVKYKRMLLGRYGIEQSGVDPRICFPTKQEALEKTEYERVAFPHTLQEMMAANEVLKREKAARIKTREEEIEKKMQKLEQWTADLNARVAKKEADARAAKERKDRLVEEVRRHFGFKVDPRDERFQEMLAQKEKEDRKKVKEAKRKEKEIKMLEKLKKKTASLEELDPNAEEIHQDKAEVMEKK
ncbi:growth arrest and DNA damage-inducible proteins-interacting protein 1 [Toxorhynchites rutilus septentrionalis]|uniref:growth arrest and DNA damage-inducible proteins-interacting protein 1 n=1 Tax=Toxorhynchites rutilus septentrionalis TaxID=329112 RepID=UPI002479A0E7|nr:growth arrest and DNA damage-inducible proteins-interacting protein 1 [Toxorhynchites rutilus septentrionalis]